jgi:nitrite reductase/ring-hydroxylating ferredoxin subunit
MTVFVLLCSFLACNENERSPIPDTQVSLTIDLNYLDADLVPALATKSFTTPRWAADRLGFGGVLVINGFSTTGATINLFAYDLACPVEFNRSVTVVADDKGKAICSKCGAIFNIANGLGMPETISKHPLKSYLVRQTGERKYSIRN